MVARGACIALARPVSASGRGPLFFRLCPAQACARLSCPACDLCRPAMPLPCPCRAPAVPLPCPWCGLLCPRVGACGSHAACALRGPCEAPWWLLCPRRRACDSHRARPSWGSWWPSWGSSLPRACVRAVLTARGRGGPRGALVGLASLPRAGSRAVLVARVRFLVGLVVALVALDVALMACLALARDSSSPRARLGLRDE